MQGVRSLAPPILPEYEESYFWKVLDDLRWQDRSEKIFTREEVTDMLFLVNLPALCNWIRERCAELQETLERRHFPQAQNLDFLSHVVACGKKVFQASLQDPEALRYLLEEPASYQSLLTLLEVPPLRPHLS